MQTTTLSALFQHRINVLTAEKLLGIGQRMRLERERLGFSCDEVSLAFHPQTCPIEAIERGDKPPSANLLYWFALAGADVTFILTGQFHLAQALCAIAKRIEFWGQSNSGVPNG